MDIAKFPSIGAPPSPMIWIGKLILPFTVVKESKEAHYSDISTRTWGNKQAILLHPFPVIGSMV
jgi:hypothetical protein